MTGRALALAFCTAAACTAAAAPGQKPGPPKKPRWGVCEREAPALLGGAAPVKVDGKKIQPPKKIRDVRPEFPPAGADLRSTVWAGELLIDQKGKVHTIWVLRHMSPAYDAAVAKAIQEWQYEPMLVDGAASPACVSLTMNVHF